ncbi:hypothetical protein [Ideonella margarita]|uniref:Uncharacterized protein n=1 Tax=Ideonella margarita TaxID=2984191 RepID=A0ABU9C7P9_9BURK
MDTPQGSAEQRRHHAHLDALRTATSHVLDAVELIHHWCVETAFHIDRSTPASEWLRFTAALVSELRELGAAIEAELLNARLRVLDGDETRVLFLCTDQGRLILTLAGLIESSPGQPVRELERRVQALARIEHVAQTAHSAITRIDLLSKRWGLRQAAAQ